MTRSRAGLVALVLGAALAGGSTTALVTGGGDDGRDDVGREVAEGLVAGAGSAQGPAPEPVLLAAPPPVTRGTVADFRARAEQRSLPAPVAVELGWVGRTASVVDVGVAADGQVEVPPDVDQAGWYRFASTPGAEAGAAVLVGHVDGQGRLGTFGALADADTGDRAVVVLADGSRLAYEVVAREQVAKPDLPVDRLFAVDGDPRLVLVTCGGDFDDAAGSYADNVVVTAVPVPAPPGP